MVSFGVIQAGDPVLDTPCIRFGLPDEATYAQEVVDRLRAVADQVGEVYVPSTGLGLAAPQIGCTRTAAIVRPQGSPEIVLLNPHVVEESVEETSGYEGCLSFFDVRGLVRRPKVIDVEHQDFDGSWHTSRFRFATARLVLHEIDHLHGLLYTARMRPGAEPIPLDKVPAGQRRNEQR